MSENVPTALGKATEEAARRYMDEVAARARGEELPPPGPKEVTLDQVLRKPIENALSLANRDPNDVISVKNAADTVEPELLEDFYRTWATKIADRSFPVYAGAPNAGDLRYRKVHETSKELVSWLDRSEGRITIWQAYEKELNRIKDACDKAFRTNPPGTMEEVQAAFNAEAKNAPADSPNMETIPKATVEEPDDDGRARGEFLYQKFSTLDPLGLSKAVHDLQRSRSTEYADSAVKGYIRYIADTRILSPAMLFSYMEAKVDEDNFDPEDALKVCLFNTLKEAHGALLQDEIKDVVKYVQDITHRNNEYAWQVRASLKNDIERIKMAEERRNFERTIGANATEPEETEIIEIVDRSSRSS